MLERKWSSYIFEESRAKPNKSGSHLIGVIAGEGIGTDLTRCAVNVLSGLKSTLSQTFQVDVLELPGEDSIPWGQNPLPEEVITFCRNIFNEGGAVLAGPVGGRFVYDLRREFDLFCKLVPIKPPPILFKTGRIKEEYLKNIDILLVRENVSGFYQGTWQDKNIPDVGRVVEHHFHYTEKEVRRILEVGARIAANRRKKMMVVVKEGGAPALSNLWRDCMNEIGGCMDVDYCFENIDYAAYLMVQRAQDLDVIVAPNLFGDILADLGGIVQGSRGLTYSGNFSSDFAAVYQTNHGAAHDLEGRNVANPVGHIYALAMLLRESFGLSTEAALVENAVSEVWRQGWRTADLVESGCRAIGTFEITDLIVEAVKALSMKGSLA